MVILSETTNKNPKPKVTRAEGLSTFITYYSIVWRKRSIPTHSGWLYPLTFDAGKGLKEA